MWKSTRSTPVRGSEDVSTTSPRAADDGARSPCTPDWANLKVLHRNTLPPRANFHLYDSEAAAVAGRISEARRLDLGGSWKFHLADCPAESPTDFQSTNFHAEKWSEIQVPGMWQLQGFGRGPQYTNIQYPFPVDPPNPPLVNNECGSYLTWFDVPHAFRNDQLRLRFEGVDSSFHVWVNGVEVGYSQGSRNPSEFDISAHVHKHKPNRLAVRVYQFCDGSYIEDQDQWWLSGIFRDVALLGFPAQAHFEDFDVRTHLDKAYTDARLDVQVQMVGRATVHLKLLDADRKVVVKASKVALETNSQKLNFSMPVDKPHKWTAETPYLYTLLISIEHTTYVAHRIGFRAVELKDGLIKINGERVVFRGANRHEHHPRSGRTVPLEFLINDLTLMKRHNINAIRTCHQPNDPRLYDLADAMGFWIVDEADLECHGFEMIGDEASWTSDNPEWHDAYVDRAQQLVHRDKLHPSVVIWSLGNEAFHGRNHTAMSKWIKAHDPTRLIHYEPDRNADDTDMYSRMYFSVDDIIREFGKDSSKQKPMVLCEYIHAMGTGPGNIKDYVDAFYKYPRLQGGWVWEWANHGLLTRTDDGIPFYGYGGDFGDVPNDSNFVMDGVCQSDHTPNSGLIEYKKAIEPVQLVKSHGNTVTIINRFDFATLDHLYCHWCVVDETGSSNESGTLDLPKDIRPGATAEINVPMIRSALKGEALLDLSFRLKERTSWAARGYELAWAQVPLRPTGEVQVNLADDTSTIKVTSTGTVLKISSKNVEWTLDKARGALTSWLKNGEEVIAQPLEPSFYRAPTDNDAPADGREWKDRNLHLARTEARSFEWSETGRGVKVIVRQKFAPVVFAWSLDLLSTYTFDASGTVHLQIRGTPAGRDPPRTLSRIGVTVGLQPSFQSVEWFGRGPGESYKDMKDSQRIGLHRAARIDDLWMAAPEFPQECGNRTETRWLRLSSGSTSVTVQFFDPFSPEDRALFDFMACHYDVHDIDRARHPFELAKKKLDTVVLRLDADHHGLGTGSCGPKTLEKYALKTEEFEFGLVLQ